MNFEDFLASWRRCLRGTGLPTIGFERTTLDLTSLCRVYETAVEPIKREQVEPFFARAVLSFRWSAIETTRGHLREEDVLTELLGREDGKVDTEPRFLRVDVKLAASTMHGKEIPMPSKDRWSAWARELMGRMESVERLLPEDVVEQDDEGRLAILAWQGEPTASIVCAPDGALRLHEVEVASWQGLTLPRNWDDPDREEEPHVESQIAKLLARVKASLYAFMEVLDHLLVDGAKG